MRSSAACATLLSAVVLLGPTTSRATYTVEDTEGPGGTPSVTADLDFTLTSVVTLTVNVDEDFTGLTRVPSGSTLALSNPDRPIPASSVFGDAAEWDEVVVNGQLVAMGSRGPGTPDDPGLIGLPLNIGITGAYSFSSLRIKLSATAGAAGRAWCEITFPPTRANAIAGVDDGTPTVEDFTADFVDEATGEGDYLDCALVLWLEVGKMEYKSPMSSSFTVEVSAP